MRLRTGILPASSQSYGFVTEDWNPPSTMCAVEFVKASFAFDD